MSNYDLVYSTAGASKAIPGFDVIDYGQEGYVFGSSSADARHWDKYVLDVFEDDQDILSELFDLQNGSVPSDEVVNTEETSAESSGDESEQSHTDETPSEKSDSEPIQTTVEETTPEKSENETSETPPEIPDGEPGQPLNGETPPEIPDGELGQTPNGGTPLEILNGEPGQAPNGGTPPEMPNGGTPPDGTPQLLMKTVRNMKMIYFGLAIYSNPPK